MGRRAGPYHAASHRTNPQHTNKWTVKSNPLGEKKTRTRSRPWWRPPTGPAWGSAAGRGHRTRRRSRRPTRGGGGGGGTGWVLRVYTYISLQIRHPPPTRIHICMHISPSERTLYSDVRPPWKLDGVEEPRSWFPSVAIQGTRCVLRWLSVVLFCGGWGWILVGVVWYDVCV